MPSRNVENIKITPQMLTQIAELDHFKATWSGFARLRPVQLGSLKKVSTIESIGSSNRIEGNKLSDSEVEMLLSRINKTSFASRDEEEVAGYAELMNIVFDDYTIIPLTENYIKQLHKILLRYVTKDVSHRGNYKKLDNNIAAFDQDGKMIGIVFQTAAPFNTPRLIDELLDWTRSNLSDPFWHPLIVIGVFVAHFLAIHPFQDGNGRLSRALTAMLLLQCGYSYIPYSSIESIIESNKEGYYRALRRTQKNIWSDEADYGPWLSFFLTTLQKQKRHLESKIATMPVDPYDLSLGRNDRAVLELFEKDPEWSTPATAGALGLNINTAAKTIKRLVDRGYLVKHGLTKGVWYTKRG
ncbi:MAG: Fic family protein [Chitinispirillales bacterium]|jgi:Fic family protein|nr:Fic family protein [Chitinispirillales bacterium]